MLAIFLSGIVITYVVNSNDWRTAYEDQERLAKAAQVTAVVAEEAMKRGIEKRNNMIEVLNSNLRVLEAQNAELLRQWETIAQEKALAEISMVAENIQKTL